MVVVPTSTHVSLHYGWTPVDLFAWALTLVGFVAWVVLLRRPPVRVPEPEPKVEPVDDDLEDRPEDEPAADEVPVPVSTG
jgi:hypothetical protein